MKKFMLRGTEEFAETEYMPKSLKYNVWYDFVTPFDWQYFKLKKGSRYVGIYNDIGDEKPEYVVSRKRFINEILILVKSPPTEISCVTTYNNKYGFN